MGVLDLMSTGTLALTFRITRFGQTAVSLMLGHAFLA
jgi:hypothetical protein